MPHPAQDRPDFLTVAREVVASQIAFNAAQPPTGVCWSGLTTSKGVTVGTVEGVAASLEAAHDAREAFCKSPSGRFLAAVGELEQLSYGAEAYALRCMWSSTISEGSALCEQDRVQAIGRAIRVLNSIDHSTARDGVAALADMLAPSLARAA